MRRLDKRRTVGKGDLVVALFFVLCVIMLLASVWVDY
jgi:hypothetical protein